MTKFDCFTCGIYLLDEKNYFQNPKLPDEKYCLKCAVRKAQLTPEYLLNLLLEN